MPSADSNSWGRCWHAVQTLAWHQLLHSEALPPHLSDDPRFQSRPRVRVWVSAGGFDCQTEPTSLTVCEVLMATEEYRFVIRRAIWRSTQDQIRVWRATEQTGAIPLLDPTIDVSDAPIEHAPLHALMKEGAEIRLPLVSLHKVQRWTTGGGPIGFEFFSADAPPAVQRLQWSWDTPASWVEFLSWFERLKALMESWLAADTGPDHAGRIRMLGIYWLLNGLRAGDTDRAGDTERTLLDLGPEAIPALIEEAAKPENRGIRATLVKVIWQSRLPSVLDFLGKALADDQPAVWKEALHGLVTIGGPQALAWLTKTRAQADLGELPNGLSAAWLDEALEQVRASVRGN